MYVEIDACTFLFLAKSNSEERMEGEEDVLLTVELVEEMEEVGDVIAEEGGESDISAPSTSMAEEEEEVHGVVV